MNSAGPWTFFDYTNEQPGRVRHEFTIGLTEPYPGRSLQEILDFIQQLQDRGYTIPYFHMDVDRIHVKNLHISELQFSKDMHVIYDFCRARGIDFAFIYTGADDKTDSAYRNTVLPWVTRSRKLLGVPEQVKFQIWAYVSKNPDGTENWNVPANLPESNLTSHSRLLLDGLFELGL